MEKDHNQRFMCGIEIHQRLKTHKLFCNCSSSGVDLHDYYHRQMHIVRSELGEIDAAAKLEIERNMEYKYYLSSNSCLVELDEEPPLEVNKEALRFALIAAKAFNCKIFDTLFVMRKTVLDGSNTSGFQRTILVGFDGYIDTSKGRVKIQTLCLEEESCGILGQEDVGNINSTKNYSLSRLGIPLLEIATAPEAKDFEHVKEIAEVIGLTLRVLGIAERGIGTIRQDLNISIPGSPRCELKGVQDLDSIPKIVELEVTRQENLKKFLSESRFNVEQKVLDITDHLKEEHPKLKEWIIKALESDKRAYVLIIKDSKGKFSYELLPNYRFGTELSHYAKSSEVKGIIHSDEDLSKYGLDRAKLYSFLNLSENDSFIMIISNEKSANESFSRIIHRLNKNYLLPETRRVNKDLYSEYMRPLPGEQRMYPETDVPVIYLTDEFLDELLKGTRAYNLQEFVNILEQDLEDKATANRLIRSRYLEIYLDLSATLCHSKEQKKVLARYLLNVLPMIQSKYKIDMTKCYDLTSEIMKLVNSNLLTRSAMQEASELFILTNSTEKVFEVYGRITDKNRLKSLLLEFNNDVSKLMKQYGKRIELNDLKELQS
ncbi:MAG: Glu-tRNA(Gln) amidotransferase subunit GatE [Candidatus Micrarchaeota archaeon]|nr:Glu-tRNA(Gln) amidotransferase subunit GatE [Candidatus Micrarchaeota archaeon]